MDLLDVKISEIKNISVIYLFNTDSVFAKEENKYLGLKVVYDNGKFIDLDYKDKHFSTLIKKVISRYKEEKDNRNIILLGDLTQKLFTSDEIIKVSEERQEYREDGLSLFKTNVERLKTFEPYLKEALKQILEYALKYQGIIIDKIDGFNKKYIVTYSHEGYSSTFAILIDIIDDSTIRFNIRSIDGLILGISGMIKNDASTVSCRWESESKNLTGVLEYDTTSSFVNKVVSINGVDVYHQSESETVLDYDREIINFYFQLFSLEKPASFIKTSDNNYIFASSKQKNVKDEAILSERHGIQLYITDSEVILTYIKRDVIDKYSNMVNVNLDEERTEIVLKKLDIDNVIHLLLEKSNGNAFGKRYEYTLYRTEEVDLKKPFMITDSLDLPSDIKSLYDVKVMALDLKGGNE